MITINDKVIIKTVPEMRTVIFDVLGDNAYPSGGYKIDVKDLYKLTDIYGAEIFPDTVSDITPNIKGQIYKDSSTITTLWLKLFDVDNNELSDSFDVSDYEAIIMVQGAFRK